MTQRWWAPTRATLEPDQVVLALLEPGGDAAGDLGNALLAVHRAGAAACETVAKGAVPSEGGLIAALATCRTALAGPAVDTISKSMEATYAGLLLRDLLDDAESSALSVFRTCVAKGVAPPIAASRAGAVFGVPAGALGKYAAMAADPRINPVSLTDTADRTLLSYVSKLVAEEVGEVKETFAKAPTGHPREYGDSSEGWEEREHPRDATTGQFVHTGPNVGPPVREGGFESITLPDVQIPDIETELSPLERLRQRLGIGGAPKVAGAPATAPPKRQLRGGDRPQPGKRQLRSSAPQTQARGQLVPRLAQAQAQPKGIAARAKALLSAAAAPKIELAQANAGAKTAPPVSAPPATRDFKGTALERDETAPQYSVMDTGGNWLTFHMTSNEALRLRRSMPFALGGSYTPGDAPRLVRGWALVKGAPALGPALLDPQDKGGHGSADSAAMLKSAADAVHDELDPTSLKQMAPMVRSIGPDDALESGSLEVDLLRYREKLAELAGHDLNGRLNPALQRQAFQSSVAVPDYYDQDTHWAVVPQMTQDNTFDIPTVDEFYIADEVRGEITGTPRHEQAILDPNQAFLVDAHAERFYDSINHVLVNRWALRPIDEEILDAYTDPAKAGLWDDGNIGKAVSDHDAVRFEQQHPRDEEGRFAPTISRVSGIAPLQLPGIQLPDVNTVAPPAPSRRQLRSSGDAAPGHRQLRRAQARPIVAAPTLPQATARAKLPPKAAARLSRLQAAMTLTARPIEARSDRRDLPVLDDRANYKLLTKAEFDELLSKLHVAGSSGAVQIYGPALAALHGKADLDGSQVIGAMNLNVEDEITNNEGEATKGYVWQRKHAGQGKLQTPDDEIAMASHIRHIFETHPEIAQIHIDYAEKPGHYVLYRNSEPIEEQVLIEYDADLNPRREMELVDLGSYRSLEMLHRRSDLDGALVSAIGDGEENKPINAKMHQFRLQNVPVRRYRMQNV